MEYNVFFLCDQIHQKRARIRRYIAEFQRKETFTNKGRRTFHKPSNEYLEVIRRGIKETYADMDDFDVMKYLLECGLS